MCRLFHEVSEIIDRNGQAHAQHDYSENYGTDIAMHPPEQERQEEGYDGTTYDNKRSIGRKKAAKQPDNLKHDSNIRKKTYKAHVITLYYGSNTPL
jgi:hypothetical protein